MLEPSLENQTFMIVDGCNLSCSYCYYETGSKVYEQAPLHPRDYERWFAACREESIELVNGSLTGGEPLLSPIFPELLDLTAAHFRHTSVMTNAVLMTPRIAEHLVTTNSRVDVSLDHVSDAIPDRVRGGTRKAMQGLRLLHDAGAKSIQISMVLTSENTTDLDPMLDFAHDVGASLELIPLGIANRHPLSLMSLSPDRRESIARWIHRHSHELGRPLYYARLQRYLMSGRINPADQCATGRDGVFISSLGDIGVCGKRPANLGNITDADPASALRRKRDATIQLPPGRCVDAVCLVLA